MKKTLLFASILVVICIMPSCEKDPQPNDNEINTTGTLNGHKWVDLGLPSGTLWATCNVGTNVPEGVGDYFAWGETEPKTTYDWSTYKYCYDNQLTKYCTSSSYGYNGFFDNLTALESMDDAAVVNWGNGWLIPTVDQWSELYQNTSKDWATQNGVKGCRFTSSNGNNIFLPFAGIFSGSELDDHVVGGFYWSSSLNTNHPNHSWYSNLCSVYCDLQGGNIVGRPVGLSVRPVTSSH